MRSNLTGAGYVRREIAPEGGRWFTNAATLADLDGDGHADLIVGNYFPDDARILDALAGGREAMQHSMSRADNGGRKHLLRWTGGSRGLEPTVQFEEARGVLDEPVASSWTLAIGAADLDGDLLPEIYLANDFGPDRLLHNRSRSGEFHFALLEGRKSLTTPNSKLVGRDSFKGMGVDFGDVNGDGRLDFFVSNIAAEYALEESHFVFVSTGETDLMKRGIAPYVDRSEPLGLSRSGWGWDTKLADFDNDGVLEALQALGFTKGTTNRWPELQELAMGNDEFLKDPESWPRFQAGDDLCGHQRNVFAVRGNGGRYWDIASVLGMDRAGREPRDRHGGCGRGRPARFRGRQPVGGLDVLPEPKPRFRDVPRSSSLAAGRSERNRADAIPAGTPRRGCDRPAGPRRIRDCRAS